MSLETQHLARLLTSASSDTRALVRTVLEQDQVDRQWTEQIGPALTQSDAARLLDVSVQAVSKNQHLLRLTNRDGRVVYPIFQFDGRRPLPGLGQVLAAFDGVLQPLTIASWLTLPSATLDGRSPAQALRDGEAHRVVAAAQQAAQAAA